MIHDAWAANMLGPTGRRVRQRRGNLVVPALMAKRWRKAVARLKRRTYINLELFASDLYVVSNNGMVRAGLNSS